MEESSAELTGPPAPERFGVHPLQSGFLAPAALEELLGPWLVAVERVGGLRCDESAIARREPLVLLLATGGTERRALELVTRRHQAVGPEPVCLIAHPGNNSLPAALKVLAKLQQMGVAGRICLLRHPGNAADLARLSACAADVRTWHALRATRIGLVGDPSEWLVASSPSLELVTERWGPAVVRLPLDDLLGLLPESSGEESEATAGVWNERAVPCDKAPTRREVSDAATVWTALRVLVGQHRLDAVAVRCFDLLKSSGTTGCLALAQLADDGLVAGCEGDLCATLGLLLASIRLGRTAWMANPTDIDVSANTVRLAHCTVPPSLTRRYSLRSHFESGRSVAVAGELLGGSTTLLRIGGERLDRVWLAEGRAAPAPPSADSCRTRLDVTLEVGSVGELLQRPLGNHLVVIPGSHLRALEECVALVG